MRFVYPEGAIPVDQDEEAALIPDHITIQAELNEWESQNIQRAVNWARSRKRSDVLTSAFVRKLHQRMFDQTWEWAGQYRQSDKNIGRPWEQIAVEVHNLLMDVEYWLTDAGLSIEEAAVRLHHRMVEIHPFVNGNGRHARLLADVLLSNHDRPPIEWGGKDLDAPGEARTAYLQALRAADEGSYEPLLAYTRSKSGDPSDSDDA